MNLAKKQGGRNPTSTIIVIPLKVTKRDCVSKVKENFYLTGKITPLTAAMKLDLHNLVITKLDWDDTIRNNLRPIWDSYFQMMNEIKSLKYYHVVIPDNAAETNIETSKDIACIAIYVRFKFQNSSYLCQLVFSRSRLISDNTTQLRAKLYATLINTDIQEK